MDVRRISSKSIFKILLIIGFFYNTIWFYAIEVAKKIPIVKNYAVFFMPVLIGALIALLIGSSAYKKRIFIADYVFLLVALLSIIFSYLIYPDNTVYINIYMKAFWQQALPFFLLGLCMDYEEDVDLIEKYANVSILIGVLYIYYTLHFGKGAEVLGDDNMGLAYNYLPCVMFSLLRACKKGGKSCWSVFVIGLIIIFSLGTRGPMLILLLFTMIMIIKQSLKRKATLYFLMLVCLGICFANWYVEIMFWFANFIAKLGLSPRVVTKLLQGSLLQDNDREYISSTVIMLIKEKPIIGYGVAGEWPYVNWNAHNMYLELLQNYGVIVGGICIVLLVILPIKAMKKSKLSSGKELVLMYACITLLQGFWGGTYISAHCFFFIGICLNVIRNSKKTDECFVEGRYEDSLVDE